MVWRRTLFVCTAIVWLVKIEQVVCSGVFELRIKSFINENGKDSLGQCCGVERSGRCVGPCHTRFRVCWKHYENKIDPNSACTFGDVMTPVLGDNNVQLAESGSNIPGFTNPIRFPFDFSWPGWFTLIVEAWHDSNPTNTTDDAGVSSIATSGVNIGGRKLISRFPMQHKLDVKAQWTEKEHKLDHSKMVYEFRVICHANYYGSGCANLCRPRNDNFGHYNCSPNGEIVCLDGWKGDYCTKPRCLSGCDEHHGYCSKPEECSCHSGWKGAMCNECERYPGCIHGSCQKPWDCLCDEGWGGLFCNQDLNYCTNHKPCRNGGTCFNTGQGSYTCSCPPGYTGTDCDKKLSDCSHKPCLNGAICEENKNSTGYRCECFKGWHGTHCEIAAQTCDNRPCQHGGTCMDTIHGYKCSCPVGYGGLECQHYINYCAPNPCANGGNCTVSLSGTATATAGYKCTCPNGFAGANCQTNVDDCHGNPCRNGGSCVDLVNNYKCHCVPGYVGDLCDNEVDYCLAKPCANGGTCEKLVNDYKCRCRAHFSGKDCSVHVNVCANSPCRNGATCYDGTYDTADGSAQCECASGYSGRYCENESSSNGNAGGGSSGTAIVGNTSAHVSGAGTENVQFDWKKIMLVALGFPTLMVVAGLIVKCWKMRRDREQRKADEEARIQNEQNSVHSSVTKRGDTHMIKNTWGQCVKNVDEDGGADILSYPKQVSYSAVPADANIALVYPLQRSRSQKQLNVDPSLLRHSICNRVSCKDLDSLVRTTTPAPLDNRLSVLSINISHSNLSDSSLSKQQQQQQQQQCSQSLEKDIKTIQNNSLNSPSVLNSSSNGGAGGSSVYVIDEHFAQTLFATEV